MHGKRVEPEGIALDCGSGCRSADRRPAALARAWQGGGGATQRGLHGPLASRRMRVTGIRAGRKTAARRGGNQHPPGITGRGTEAQAVALRGACLVPKTLDCLLFKWFALLMPVFPFSAAACRRRGHLGGVAQAWCVCITG